jgi:hypothetical protein
VGLGALGARKQLVYSLQQPLLAALRLFHARTQNGYVLILAQEFAFHILHRRLCSVTPLRRIARRCRSTLSASALLIRAAGVLVVGEIFEIFGVHCGVLREDFPDAVLGSLTCNRHSPLLLVAL